MEKLVRIRMIRLVLSFLLACILTGTTVIDAQAASARKINANVQHSLAEFRQDVRGANEVLSKARGVLVFPKVYQGGFVFGGQYGQGALIVNGKTVDYYRITSGSVGFQLGGQRKSLIIAFMNDDALNNFRNSPGWVIGADASATVVVVGAEGSINSGTLNQPILAFVIDQKGLMYDLSLQGTKISKLNL